MCNCGVGNLWNCRRSSKFVTFYCKVCEFCFFLVDYKGKLLEQSNILFVFKIVYLSKKFFFFVSFWLDSLLFVIGIMIVLLNCSFFIFILMVKLTFFLLGADGVLGSLGI